MTKQKQYCFVAGKLLEGNKIKQYLFCTMEGQQQWVAVRSVGPFLRSHTVVNCTQSGGNLVGKDGFAIGWLPKFKKNPNGMIQQVCPPSLSQVYQKVLPLIKADMQKEMAQQQNQLQKEDVDKKQKVAYLVAKLGLIEQLITQAIQMKDLTNALAEGGSLDRYLKQIDANNMGEYALANQVRTKGVNGLAEGLKSRLQTLYKRMTDHKLQNEQIDGVTLVVKCKQLSVKCEEIKKLHLDTKKLIVQNRKALDMRKENMKQTEDEIAQQTKQHQQEMDKQIESDKKEMKTQYDLSEIESQIAHWEEIPIGYVGTTPAEIRLFALQYQKKKYDTLIDLQKKKYSITKDRGQYDSAIARYKEEYAERKAKIEANFNEDKVTQQYKADIDSVKVTIKTREHEWENRYNERGLNPRYTDLGPSPSLIIIEARENLKRLCTDFETDLIAPLGAKHPLLAKTCDTLQREVALWKKSKERYLDRRFHYIDEWGKRQDRLAEQERLKEQKESLFDIEDDDVDINALNEQFNALPEDEKKEILKNYDLDSLENTWHDLYEVLYLPKLHELCQECADAMYHNYTDPSYRYNVDSVSEIMQNFIDQEVYDGYSYRNAREDAIQLLKGWLSVFINDWNENQLREYIETKCSEIEALCTPFDALSPLFIKYFYQDILSFWKNIVVPKYKNDFISDDVSYRTGDILKQVIPNADENDYNYNILVDLFESYVDRIKKFSIGDILSESRGETRKKEFLNINKRIITGSLASMEPYEYDGAVFDNEITVYGDIDAIDFYRSEV